MTNALKPTCDRKTKFHPNQKNTFGLLPGIEGTCPYATTAEGGCWRIEAGKKLPTCYVAHTMSVYKNVYDVLAHNTKLLMSASKWHKIELLDKEFHRFKDVEGRRFQAGKPSNQYYRLHWSGDIFNEEYAQALKDAMLLNSDIQFWCYTRSLFAVPILCNVPNLNLYISLDPVNVQQGLAVFNECKRDDNNLQICYMNYENDFEEHALRARKILDEENRLRKLCGYPVKEERIDGVPMRACPVDLGKLKLEGGCASCRQCTKEDSQPVWFKS
jgi:hypothetical protein